MKSISRVVIGIILLAGCASPKHRATPQVKSEGHSASPFLYLTVTITNTSPFIYVGGEVMKPGRFAWTAGLTLTNAIQLAGGFTDFANKARIEIRRSDGSRLRFSYARILAGRTNNPVLNRYEVVEVGKKFLW